MKKLFIILMIPLFFACEKEKIVTYSNSLIGNWEWFMSCGGVVGCTYASSYNYTIKINFTEDSVYNYYRNDTLLSSMQFHTYKQISKDGAVTRNFLKYDSTDLMYSVYHDTLSLSDWTWNGGSAYKRIK